MNDQLDSVKRAHRALFDDFVWVSDMDNFKVPEKWTRPRRVGSKLKGDCDDFAMEMDHRTSNLIPLSNRRFCIARVQKHHEAQDHCMLAFIFGDEIWISDCRHPTLMLRDRLNYDMWAWNKGALNAKWEMF